MKNKKKVLIVAAFVVVLAALAVLGWTLNQRATQQGKKSFEVEIISERDQYSKTETFRSDAEYLGQFLREMEGCEWSDSEWGIYITGFHGMQEDMENQYWWCVIVNGESSMVGADEVPLCDGDKYTFELKQGW